jgi:hypothetical protein
VPVGDLARAGEARVDGMTFAPLSLAFITQRKPTGCASAIDEPWMTMQSAFWRSYW